MHNVTRLNKILAVFALALITTSRTLFGGGGVEIPPVETATFSPFPGYPYEARKWHMTGTGLYLLRVDIKTGKVKRVTVARSTGHGILDRSAIFALERWRFQPGKLRPIRELRPDINDPNRDTDSILQLPVSFGSRTR